MVNAAAASAISAVVCTRNVVRELEACCAALRANGVREIVVVDGLSSDGTLELAQRLADRVLSDAGGGLAHARNLGLQAATGEFVAFVGPDNIMPPGSMDRMLAELDRAGWVGVSAVTRCPAGGRYLTRSMDFYKRLRFYPGERPVIGTPTIYRRAIHATEPYDTRCEVCDDSDLCARLGARGFRVGIADVEIIEQSEADLPSVIRRWRWYGLSDAQYYAKYAPGWGVPRKIRSFLHPLRSEFYLPAREALRRGRPGVLPFLALITVLRYSGWIRTARKAARARRAAPREVPESTSSETK